RRLERGPNNNYTPSDRGSPNGCRKSPVLRRGGNPMRKNARGVSDAPCERAFEEGLNGSACGRETGGSSGTLGDGPRAHSTIPALRPRWYSRTHSSTSGFLPKMARTSGGSEQILRPTW